MLSQINQKYIKPVFANDTKKSHPKIINVNDIRFFEIDPDHIIYPTELVKLTINYLNSLLFLRFNVNITTVYHNVTDD